MGAVTCGGEQYRTMLQQRYEGEASNLAELTGWKIDDIRKKMDLVTVREKKWWEW